MITMQVNKTRIPFGPQQHSWAWAVWDSGELVYHGYSATQREAREEANAAKEKYKQYAKKFSKS